MSRTLRALVTCFGAVSMSSALHAQTASVIESNFNGTFIKGGSSLWFNSHLTSISFSGEAASAEQVTLYVANATVTFEADGKPYVVEIPDTQIRFSNSAGAASGYFGDGKWMIEVPKSEFPFIGGLMWDVPAAGLQKGINPVAWSAEFSTDIGEISDLQWQWSAAVYAMESPDPNDLGVLWVKGERSVGTPMAYRSYVVGGARGGGGSNYTGSWSSTGKVTDIAVAAPLPTGELSISKNLWLQGTAIPVGYQINR